MSKFHRVTPSTMCNAYDRALYRMLKDGVPVFDKSGEAVLDDEGEQRRRHIACHPDLLKLIGDRLKHLSSKAGAATTNKTASNDLSKAFADIHRQQSVQPALAS